MKVIDSQNREFEPGIPEETGVLESAAALFKEMGAAGSVWKAFSAKDMGKEVFGLDEDQPVKPFQSRHVFSQEFDWDRALEIMNSEEYTDQEIASLLKTKNDASFYEQLGLIHETRENIQTISAGDGLGLSMAALGAVVFDPANALGVGVISKVNALKNLNNARKGLLIGGTVGALEEGFIQSTNPNANIGQSLVTVGAVAAIGGGLGKLVDKSTARSLRFQNAIRTEIVTEPPSAPKSMRRRTPKGLQSHLDAKVAPAWGFERISAITAPVVRLMSGPSRTIRNVAHRMMSTSFQTTDNLKGIASPEALSHKLLNEGHADHNQFLIGLEQKWASYVTDGAEAEVGPIKQRIMGLEQRLGRKYQDKLNFKTFDEMVGKYQAGALLRSEVPDAVAEAADDLNKIFKKWEPRARQHWKGNAGGTGRYLTRRYNMQAIAAAPRKFAAFVLDQWLKKNPDSSPEEYKAMEDIVGRRIDKMLAAPDERIHLEEIWDETTRGSMNERYWDFIDDAELHKTDFVSHSAKDILANYSRSVINDTLFAEHFGELSIKKIMQGIRKDTYAEFDLGKLSAKDKAFLDEELDFLEDMIHRVRGTYMDPHSALPGSVSSRAVSALLKFNNLRLGGEFMLSSFPDIGRPVMHLGLMRSYGPAFKAFIGRNREIMDAMGKANAELRAWNIGNELHLNQRMNVMTDTSSAAINRTPLEAGLNAANENFFLLNGLTLWNQMLKRNTGIAVVDKIISSSEKFAKGKLTQKARRQLAQMGLDEKDLKIIGEQFEKHGTTVDRVRLNDFGNWDRNTRQTRARMIAAVQKEVDTIIVTPDVGDIPLLMSNDLVKLVAQYKTFALGSATRMTLRGLQDPDQRLAGGILISILAGAAVQDYKEWKKGKPLNLQDTVSSGIDRSGILTTIAMGNEMLSQTPFGNLAITGAQSYQDWNPYILGPTAAAFQDGLRVTRDLGNMQVSDGGKAAAGRLLPFHNLLGINDLMFGNDGPNEFTKEVNNFYRSQ